MRYRFTLSLLFAFCLAACSGPEFVNHPRPALAVDSSAWQPYLAECPPDASGRHRCPPESAAGALGCDVLALPDDLLGGLDRDAPIARCELHARMDQDDGMALVREMEQSRNYVLSTGGLFAPSYTRYLTLQDGALTLLSNRQQLQAAYAPVESAEEALSLALAATGWRAYYGLQREDALEYEVDRLEDTHVTSTAEGFEVLLYVYQVFGCGPHWTDAVWLTVSRDGTLDVADRWHVYRNPDEDGLCAD